MYYEYNMLHPPLFALFCFQKKQNKIIITKTCTLRKPNFDQVEVNAN